MEKPKKYELEECDKQLFKRMKKEAVSENERRFFKEMEYRQQYHLTTNDFLLQIDESEEKIGFYRFNTEWYMLTVESWCPDGFLMEYGCLSDFLFDGYISEIRPQFRNMLEYLRSIDYEGINYHADQDWD